MDSQPEDLHGLRGLGRRRAGSSAHLTASSGFCPQEAVTDTSVQKDETVHWASSPKGMRGGIPVVRRCGVGDAGDGASAHQVRPLSLTVCNAQGGTAVFKPWRWRSETKLQITRMLKGLGEGELLPLMRRGWFKHSVVWLSACGRKGQCDSAVVQLICGHVESFCLEICPCPECLEGGYWPFTMSYMKGVTGVRSY